MNPLDFFDKYKSVGKADEFIGSELSIRQCMFCGKTENETSFRQKAHIIPELLGQNDWLNEEECDECNAIFSKYESHLATFVSPYVVLMNVRTKKRVPTFQSRSINRDPETFTKLKVSPTGNREVLIGSIDDYQIDEAAKTMTLTFRKRDYRPLWVYKALLRIGLTLLPNEERIQFRDVFDWLLKGDKRIAIYPHLLQTPLLRSRFQKPFAELYKAERISTEEGELPEYTLILGFANVVFQIFLPFTEEFAKVHDGKKNLIITCFPAFAWDKIDEAREVELKTYDLSIDEPISQDQKISFSFQGVKFQKAEPSPVE